MKTHLARAIYSCVLLSSCGEPSPQPVDGEEVEQAVQDAEALANKMGASEDEAPQ